MFDCCSPGINTEKNKFVWVFFLNEIWDEQRPAEHWEEMNRSKAEPFWMSSLQ